MIERIKTFASSNLCDFKILYCPRTCNQVAHPWQLKGHKWLESHICCLQEEKSSPDRYETMIKYLEDGWQVRVPVSFPPCCLARKQGAEIELHRGEKGQQLVNIQHSILVHWNVRFLTPYVPLVCWTLRMFHGHHNSNVQSLLKREKKSILIPKEGTKRNLNSNAEHILSTIMT
jgi:hypothetical protein